MTTYYALPTLTDWYSTIDGTGWSLSSGGADIGTTPTSGDDVIFDSNSGSNRSINFPEGNFTVNSVTVTGGFTSTMNVGDIFINSSLDFTGISGAFSLHMPGTGNLKVPSATINTLEIQSGANITLQSNLTLSAYATFAGSFNASSFNITCQYVVHTGGTLNMGSGIWSLFSLGGTDTWSDSGGTLVGGTSTLKFTGSGSGLKQINASKTFYNFWNATTGSGAVLINGSCTFNNFRIDSGRTQLFAASSTNTVTSFTADGTTSSITIDVGSSGSFTLAKSGGGKIYCDRIALGHCIGSPASTWNARSSVSTATNTNWTFIPGNSGFFNFF